MRKTIALFLILSILMGLLTALPSAADDRIILTIGDISDRTSSRMDGEAFAILETSGKYVHEDEAAEHKLNVPVGRYYYRVWTNSRDFETLFLTIFAISETEQAVVE